MQVVTSAASLPRDSPKENDYIGQESANGPPQRIVIVERRFSLNQTKNSACSEHKQKQRWTTSPWIYCNILVADLVNSRDEIKPDLVVQTLQFLRLLDLLWRLQEKATRQRRSFEPETIHRIAYAEKPGISLLLCVLFCSVGTISLLCQLPLRWIIFVKHD